MSTMIVEIYDALKDAGASEDKARAAATVVAGGDQMATKADLAAVRADLNQVETRLEGKIEAAQVAMIKWFTGVMIAQAAAIVALIKVLP